MSLQMLNCDFASKNKEGNWAQTRERWLHAAKDFHC